MNNIEQLLEKLRRGQCTLEELKELNRYFKENDGAAIKGFLDEDVAKITCELDASKGQVLWANIKKQTISKTENPGSQAVKVKRLILRWSSVAAAILLVVVGLVFFGKETSLTAENETPAVKEITLPDGSTVWLNRGSKIIYQYAADEQRRLVELTGEAFFEVVSNKKRPFTVSAGQSETTVLGTAFNVKAPEGQNEIEIALVEGKVQVEFLKDTAVVLSPGEQIIYDTDKHQLIKQLFQQDSPYAWKNGIIHFQKASVQEVAATLEKWYGGNFLIESDSLIQGKLVHRYDTNNLNLDQVLEGISQVMDYTFIRRSTNVIVIQPK